MREDDASLFDGWTGEEVGDALAGLPRRRFAAGTVLIAQGERRRQTFFVESGAADVVVVDGRGREHRLNRVGPGATLGEMSLLTGEPAGGTVRAATDLDVVVLSEADFERLATAFPSVYRNLSAILARRLARVTRRATGGAANPLTVLLDRGAPPLLGFALASSVAWHTRSPALLVVLDEDPPAELAALAAARGGASLADADPTADGRVAGRGARVIATPPTGAFAPERLSATIEDLFRANTHILVQTAGQAPPLRTARVVTLVGPRGRPDAAGPGHAIRGWVDRATHPRPDADGVLNVPPPSAADERAVADGLLGLSTDFGRTLGWAARDLARLKVGLALGAGSTRGYAHVGVLQALERAGVPIDYVAGTSIGAAVAALHAAGYRPGAIAATLDSLAPALFRVGMPDKGLLSSVAMRRTMRRLGTDTRIEDLAVPLALVAADIDLRREVVFRRGLVWLAVLASTAIPGMYPAQRVGHYTLVDGGVLNPVPSDVAADMGADAVIGVLLGRQWAPADTDAEAIEATGGVPSLFGVVRRSVDIMENRISTLTAGAATVVIAPHCEEPPGSRILRLRRFADGRRYIAAGEAATADALPRLATVLPWVAT
jgi:NTE family protein